MQLSATFLLCWILKLGRQQITALTVADFFESGIYFMSSFLHLDIISSK